MTFETVTAPPRLRISDAISEQIERLIVDGTLGPGEALPSERELAKRLGVSRPSLREALLKMEVRGLLQVRRGGGFAVTDVTAQTMTDPLVHLLNAYPKATADILELRQGLETLSAYYAALRATESDLQKLQKVFSFMERPRRKSNSRREAELDAEFHLMIAEASHNVALVHVMRGVFNLLRKTVQRSREAVFEEQGSLALIDRQHRALFDAIMARDPVTAREAAQVHLNFVQSNVREFIRRRDALASGNTDASDVSA